MRPTKTSHSFEVKGHQVKFSSTFDSGNLRSVTQLGTFKFLVESSLDTYQTPATSKSFFHFKVQNYPLNESIIILIKEIKLLECLKSERRKYYKPWYSYNGQDYFRINENCAQIKQNDDGIDLQIIFEMAKPTIYFSFALPYSYERYLNMVRDLPEDHKQFYLKKEVLCYSKNLNLVYMITITSYDKKTIDQDQIGSSTNGVILPQRHLNDSRIYFDKPVILLSARVHPGETPSSWALEGIIHFLIGNSDQAQLLRKNFLIVIVPMLNPDGVYEGMYRLDTQGHNLNRYYLVSDNRQPSIYSMKHLIKHYNLTKRLLFYFDFHGHPSYKGSFLYGNAIDDIAYQAQTELFGRIMSINCDTFEEKYCIFDREQMNSKDKYDMYTKQGCARVYAFKTANILHSYTVQMGFHGCTEFPTKSQKSLTTFYYTKEDYYKEGIAVLTSVLEVSGFLKSHIDKNLLRKEIAIQILTREQRFRKQDKNVSKKKKNVNEIINNQYWGPIRDKFFSLSQSHNFPKIRKSSKKKIISRTNFISSVLVNKQREDNEKSATIDQAPQKLYTEVEFSYEATLAKFYYEKKKNIKVRQMTFSSKRQREKQRPLRQSQSPTKRPQKKMLVEKQIQRIQIEKIDKKCPIEKGDFLRPKRNQIKILSGRNKVSGEVYLKGGSQKSEQFTFNDLNLRKKKIDEGNSQSNPNFCMLSAEKISTRVDQLKQIFKSESRTNNSYSKKGIGQKRAKNFKKYSSFFT